MKWLKRAAKVPGDVSSMVKQDLDVVKERKQMKKARVKPRGYLLRKFGVGLFWLAFLFMLFIIGNSLFASDNVESTEPAVENTVKVTSIEATEFAKRFAKTYFTWAPTETIASDREEALAMYLGENVEAFAGLDVVGSMWEGKVKDTEIKDIQKLSAETSLITVKVTQSLTQVTKEGAQGLVAIPKEEQQTKEAVKYLVVPIAYSGSQFFVYTNPMFTYMDETKTNHAVDYGHLQEAPIEVVQEITNFLPTFFKAYAEDEQEQLNYLLAQDNLVTGLQESMHFEEVKDVKVYLAEKGYLVFATVKLTDPDTSVPVETTYQVEVTQNQASAQYVVSGVNNYKGIEIVN